jgi:glucose-6-phosphate isomerase
MKADPFWQRYRNTVCRVASLGLTVDVSRMRFDDTFLSRMAEPLAAAFADMDELERGAIANPDENRMVGHYWLRAPELAPNPHITAEIRKTIAEIEAFATGVHGGTIRPPQAARFTGLLCIGIGGSALGPMFVADALGDPTTDPMHVHFIDNTDPDGIARTLRQLSGKLGETLCIVESKSGGTPETRNGMLLVREAYTAAGLHFPPHAVAVTLPGSELDRSAVSERWLARFPMYDWVGGRTSVLSAVGLLPATLLGLDITGLLDGAAECDVATRQHDVKTNPAALMALMWYHATGGKGQKDMVVLPYKDRLLLLSRYLQQLVMESLGKEFDRNGTRVLQGLTVYGNKGSTDQHAYVQQLREGVPNFFTVFIRVLEDGGSSLEVSPGATAGDYLHGFLLGTRAALYENGRESITITIPRVDARSIGALIALFERTVGLYASLIGINAYHQPGVEAGKKAAASVLELQAKVLATLSEVPRTAADLALAIGSPEATETIFLILEHLAANGRARMVETGPHSEPVFCHGTVACR